MLSKGDHVQVVKGIRGKVATYAKAIVADVIVYPEDRNSASVTLNFLTGLNKKPTMSFRSIHVNRLDNTAEIRLNLIMGDHICITVTKKAEVQTPPRICYPTQETFNALPEAEQAQVRHFQETERLSLGDALFQLKWQKELATRTAEEI